MECYVGVTSARPGDVIAIHASTPNRSCTVEVARVGLKRELLFQEPMVEVGNHPTPADADANGCHWPIAIEICIPEHTRPGYYEVKCTDPTGAAGISFVCVRPAKSAPRARFLLILATNTYVAYNYWGGANSYAHVGKLMSRELDPAAARDAAIGRLSTQRPFPRLLLNPPEDVPRLLNRAIRGFNEPGIPGDKVWSAQHRPSPYDGSAGFVNKWEHLFVRWCERNGIELDYATDYDFEVESELLKGYSCVLFVGHSEYWSLTARQQLDVFVENGGNVAIFAGNTSYWKVRWEDAGKTMIAHKWRGERDDPNWPSDDATHLWSHPAFGKPEGGITGLSFLYGGYHRLAMCVARGAAGYTIYNTDHWALSGSDLMYGDVLGGEIALIGYENDGCPIGFDRRGLPCARGGAGIPDNLEIIGIAAATIAEDMRSPFAGMIPPEQSEVLAAIAYPEAGVDATAQLLRGHAVMASHKRGKGEVFNAGTTEWAHGLAAGDRHVEIITQNVLQRFGGLAD
jgi:hypothetical protein